MLRDEPHRVHAELREVREGWSAILKAQVFNAFLLFTIIYIHISSYLCIYHPFHPPQSHTYSVTFYASHILYTIHIVTYFIQHLVSQLNHGKITWESKKQS